MKLQIIPTDLLLSFKEEIDEVALSAAFISLVDAEISTDGFSFYTSVASVYSSKIEGAEIELDSYIKHKRFGIQFQPDYTRKIDDLYTAYQFVKNAPFTRATLNEAHKLLTRHILPEKSQGKFRSQNMYVTTNDGQIEYVAATPYDVPAEMEKLYADITTLQEADLSISEVFFFASMIHLVFVKIHPWADGNGRSARLLEKWFLTVKLGEKAWFVQSEKYYYEHHRQYYDNIRALGLEYEELDYSKAGTFVRMLVGAILK
ncbi:Fic family protein [Chitinophaga rhizosphaerae]|uniref:Fic family protein n=1 Tax=Chitinophaga rhizosphaerae TaxID=1864947 RepID=UPI000F80BEAC|nr:Fic family protein [Chitinophaga rhizosphaerae]